MEQHMDGDEGPKEASLFAYDERLCSLVLFPGFIFKGKDAGLGGQSLLPAPSRGTQDAFA